MKINIFRGISSYYNIIYSKFRISLKIIDEDKIYLWGITLKHTIMNTTEMEGKWNKIKGNAKQQYGIAVDDDSTYSEGTMDKLVGQIQESTGKAKEAIKKEIASW